MYWALWWAGEVLLGFHRPMPLLQLGGNSPLLGSTGHYLIVIVWPVIPLEGQRLTPPPVYM